MLEDLERCHCKEASCVGWVGLSKEDATLWERYKKKMKKMKKMILPRHNPEEKRQTTRTTKTTKLYSGVPYFLMAPRISPNAPHSPIA